MARTVRDVALLFQVMAGPDDRDPQSLPNTGEDFVTATEAGIRGVRLAWSIDLGYAPIDPLVRQITTAAVKRFVDLGCQVEEANPAFENPDHLFRALTAPMRAANLSSYLDEWRDQIDPILLQRISQAEGMTAIVYEQLTQKRMELWQIARRFFARYDLLVTPTVAVPPFAIGINYPTEIDSQKVDSPLSWIPFTFPFNLTGQPAISIPCGWTDEGLPVGLQIVGRRFADAMVLRAAAAFERAAPWANKRPTLK